MWPPPSECAQSTATDILTRLLFFVNFLRDSSLLPCWANWFRELFRKSKGCLLECLVWFARHGPSRPTTFGAKRMLLCSRCRSIERERERERALGLTLFTVLVNSVVRKEKNEREMREREREKKSIMQQLYVTQRGVGYLY